MRGSEAAPERDLYALLNVSPEASCEEIRKAYRQLAQVYHPDKYQDAQVCSDSFFLVSFRIRVDLGHWTDFLQLGLKFNSNCEENGMN